MKKWDLKSVITVVICLAMVGFTWAGIISSEMFVSVGTAVFTYYFTKKKGGESDENKYADSSNMQNPN